MNLRIRSTALILLPLLLTFCTPALASSEENSLDAQAVSVDADLHHLTESSWCGRPHRPLTHHPLKGRTGRGIEFPGHPAGKISLPSSENRMLHGFGHKHRVQGSGNPGIHQHRIRA